MLLIDTSNCSRGPCNSPVCICIQSTLTFIWNMENMIYLLFFFSINVPSLVKLSIIFRSFLWCASNCPLFLIFVLLLRIFIYFPPFSLFFESLLVIRDHFVLLWLPWELFVKSISVFALDLQENIFLTFPTNLC